jgi:hypothetical protein
MVSNGLRMLEQSLGVRPTTYGKHLAAYAHFVLAPRRPLLGRFLRLTGQRLST